MAKVRAGVAGYGITGLRLADGVLPGISVKLRFFRDFC